MANAVLRTHGVSDSKTIRETLVDQGSERAPEFWWVNQNQTYKHEIEGGYMWSPKTNKNGARNVFYENMRRVNPGDIVFSFCDQHISQLGVITSRGYDNEKPKDFSSTENEWSNDGWRVDVSWTPALSPIKPKTIIDELRPHLPEKYSPLDPKTGRGRQNVYLARIPQAMADTLLKHLETDSKEILLLDSVVLSELSGEDLREAIVEERIKRNRRIERTEKEALILARVGQGRFRRNVEQNEKGCRLTGICDKRLLRASHIKAWAKCTSNEERLDGGNGLLLTPAADHLFDRGLITFTDEGTVLVSSKVNLNDLARLGILPGAKLKFGEFSDRQKFYLSYHRVHAFKR